MTELLSLKYMLRYRPIYLKKTPESLNMLCLLLLSWSGNISIPAGGFSQNKLISCM